MVMNRNKPIMIEFVGFPCAGKTSVAERLKERIIEEGYSCRLQQEILNEIKKSTSRIGIISRKPQNLIDQLKIETNLCILALAKPKIIFNIIIIFFKNFYLSSTMPKRAVTTFLKRLLFIEKLKLLYTDYDFIILDQGIVQAFYFLVNYNKVAFNDKKTLNSMESWFPYYLVANLVVLLSIDVDTSMTRVKLRSKKNNPWDKLRSELLQQIPPILKQYLILQFRP